MRMVMLKMLKCWNVELDIDVDINDGYAGPKILW